MKTVRKKRLFFLFLFAGIILVAVGIANGDVRAVFQKGSRICLECIGIG